MTTATTLYSPVDAAPIGEWSDASADEVRAAVDRAVEAADSARRVPVWERCERLLATAAYLETHADEIARDLVIEHGKVLAEARAEVDIAAGNLRSSAECGRQVAGSLPHVADPGMTVQVRPRPLGAIAVITPWNFPLNIPLEYIGPALAAGNTVVWKPAETTPRTSRHLLAALQAGGWSADDVIGLSGGGATGAALVDALGTAAVCFTGSTAVGTQIAARGAGRSLLLELGGNGPSIVLDDADVELAARAVVAGAAFCSGQSCAATERVLVASTLRTQFADAVLAATKDHALGNPFDDGVGLGPLHLRQTADTMRAHVEDATKRGARLLCGGKPRADAGSPTYWPLTVLDEVSDTAQVFVEETFGPIVPITYFADERELAVLTRAGGYGLSGAVFTEDLRRGLRLADDLPVGTVVINEQSNYWETHVPFGGHPGSRSGVGRVGVPAVLRELSTTQTVAFRSA